MPEMDGVQLLEQIRADPELAAIPVVFVSVFTNMAELEGEWIVSKPIDADELRGGPRHRRLHGSQPCARGCA